MDKRSFSMRLLEGFEIVDQVRLGLASAHLSLPFWQRAFPEAEAQAPLRKALSAVSEFCVDGRVLPDIKDIAVCAYQTVSKCNLPHGDILRQAGFSAAHIAMAPWFYETKQMAKASHAAMISIDYCEAVHKWFDQMPKFEMALTVSAAELRHV